jgi:hypothetical protein
MRPRRRSGDGRPQLDGTGVPLENRPDVRLVIETDVLCHGAP